MMNITRLHSKVWSHLETRRSKLPHALLISGQRGVGKYDLIHSFAKSLLCENPQKSKKDCSKCLACGWMAQGNHPDFRLIQPEAFAEEVAESEGIEKGKKSSQQITIDQIRVLNDFLHVGTHRHGLRIVLINPADAMNRSTANALLKSLEEPVVNTLFLLCSSEPYRLLPTIRSRCQSILVPPPSHDLALAWLNDRGIKNPRYYLALAGGSPLLAADLAQSDNKGVLGGLLGEWGKGSSIDPIMAAVAIDRLMEAGKKNTFTLKRIVEWTQKWLLDLALAGKGLGVRYFKSQTELLLQLSKSTNTIDLLAFSRKAIQYRLYCEQPLNNRLFLEELFMTYKSLFLASKEHHV